MSSSDERVERWSEGWIVRAFFDIGRPELVLERRRLMAMVDVIVITVEVRVISLSYRT